MVVDSDNNNGNNHHDGSNNTCGNQPYRNGAANDVVNACPVVEESERPKAENRKLIGIDGTTQYLGNQIIGST